MNSKKILKRYIGGYGWVFPTGCVLIAVGAGLLEVVMYDIFGWLMVPGMLLFVWGFFGEIPRILGAGGIAKWLARMGKLDDAAAELQGIQAKVLCRNKVTVTANFIFGKRMLTACAYEDILWVYKHRYTQRLLFIPIFVQDSLVLETTKRKMNINLGRKDKNNELIQIIQIIREKNPGVLTGYTEENQKAYKQLRKQKERV